MLLIVSISGGFPFRRRPPLGTAAATLAGLVATGVVLGYLLRVEVMISVIPGWPPMAPSIAVLSLLTCLALLLLAPARTGRYRRWTGYGLAALVVAAAGSGILKRFGFLDTGLPDLLALGRGEASPSTYLAQGPSPVRSPLVLLLIGLSLLLLDTDARRGRRPAQLLAATGALVVAVAGLGTFLGLDAMSRELRGYVMPIPTQVTLLLLAVAVIACRRDGLTVRIYTSPRLGGRTVRHLAPAMAAVVVLIGAVIATITRTGIAVDGLVVTIALSALFLALHVVLLRAGAVLDEADQRQTELIDQLREQRDFNETVMASLNEGVLTLAPDGQVLHVNPRWCELTGYAAGDVVGRRPPYPWWPAPRAGERSGSSGRLEFNTEVVHADGHRVPVHVTMSALRTDDHAHMSVVTYRDLTRRDRDEAERQRMARQLDHFFTMSRDLLCIASTDGYFKRVNPVWEQVLGFSADELVSRPYVEFIHPDDIGRTADAAAGLTVGRPAIAFENRFRTSGGDYRWLNWTATAADQEGVIYAVARDDTERRRTEQALAAARDEALAAARLKSQFVAMVSHEIRTPMNGVIGLTKLLLDTPLQPAQRRYGEAIRTSARALLAIINDILDFSKIEAGKVELVDAPFDLGALVEDVAHAGAAAARDKDLDILTYYPADLPAAVHGDEGRIRQVLLNLVGNAVKFTHEGHVLLRLDPADHGDRFTFSIIDTGIGIDADRIASLFEPFTQADGSHAREFGGTGLGLTISRQLVELMGGRLEVQSRPGRGSRFFFTLPLQRAEEYARRPRRIRDELAVQRLLIADGNHTSRQFLAEHGSAWGLSVQAAATAEAAARELTAADRDGTPFDVAVIDEHLPDIGGPALVRTILATPGLPRPNILLVTRDPSTDHGLTDTDGVDVLAKPVGPSTLYNYLLQRLPTGAAGDDQPGPDGPAPSTRGRVLLAEDNEINQIVATDTLATLGYDVDIASNGAEALELARSHPYQAVLMDCQMPKLDGYQATEELRRTEAPGEHIPIIAMTAGVLKEDRRRARQAGMDDFLAKPIDADELRSVLERWTAPTRH